MIEVIHDGIDTDGLRPDRGASLKIGGRLTLTRDQEVVTFVARNLEPYRGYHIFARALPELLRRRPNAHVVIVGGNDVSYGAKPPNGNWRDIFWSEVASDVERSRVHFVGTLPYDLFVTLMRVSSLHVYLTYPFVLSWSLLEAMALGAPILASQTAPLLEVIDHAETGLLFPFFDKQALVDGACAILEDDRLREKLRENARALVREHYDLQTICLPRQIEWLERVRRSDPVVPEMD